MRVLIAPQQCLNECREKIDQAHTQANPQDIAVSGDVPIDLGVHIAGNVQEGDIPNAPENTVSTYFFKMSEPAVVEPNPNTAA